MSRIPPPFALFAVAMHAAGCVGAPPPPPVGPPQAAAPIAVERVQAPPKAEAITDRLGLQILIVSDTATFLDRRRLALGRGSLRVSVHRVPADLDPASVTVRTLTPGAQLDLIEARFYSGAITPAQLLGPYVGKEVTAYLRDDGAQGEHAHPAILVGLVDDLPVVSIDKEIRVLDTGRVAVPKLPEALREEPTLELLVASDRDEQDVEIAYRSRKVDAEMAYQLVRSPGSDFAELVGLVGVSNDTGTPLVDASVTLSTDTGEPLEFGSPDTVARAGTTQVRLASPISLGAGQRATVRLFGPTPVTLARKVVVEGSGLPSYSTTPEDVSNASIRAVLDAAAKDGEPLSPGGLVAGQAHLSEKAAGEPPRAYGAAMARPLPRAKGMRIDLGDERKYPARRRLVARRDLGRCVVESAWEVTLSNPTENPVPIEDVEPVSGKYEVLDSSIPVLATEPDLFVFALTVPPHGEAKLKFRVKTTTCVVKRRGYWQSWGSKKGSAWKEGK